jgi:hypothetical protein
VTNSGDVLHVQERSAPFGAEAYTTLRIGYAIDSSTAIAARVTSFGGGYVKRSEILKRVTTVEYVPLMGAWHEVRLDCPVLLRGVKALK